MRCPIAEAEKEVLEAVRRYFMCHELDRDVAMSRIRHAQSQLEWRKSHRTTEHKEAPKPQLGMINDELAAKVLKDPKHPFAKADKVLCDQIRIDHPAGEVRKSVMVPAQYNLEMTIEAPTAMDALGLARQQVDLEIERLREREKL